MRLILPNYRSSKFLISGISSQLSVSCATFKSHSFLSDRDGVKNFVELLGNRERKMLFDELKIRHSSESEGNSSSDQMQPPTMKQLRQLALHQALPFIGFGFLDNFIMIVAGEYIDTSIGVTLGISTMAAAGLGNAISDVAGIGSAYYVERFASKVGVQYPKLSEDQIDMARTRFTAQFARVIGILFGCIIGMVPLLLYPKVTRSKESKHE